MARPILIACIVAAALSASPAVTAQVTEAGAETIRSGIAAYLDRLCERSSGRIAPTGPVAVTANGDHYDLSVPMLAIVGLGGTIAGLDATVRPTPEGWLEVAPAFSGPPFVATAEGGGVVALTVARQSGHLTYAPEYRSTMSADLAFEGLAVATPWPAASVSLGALTFDVASMPVGGDHYDQTTVLAAEGFDTLIRGGFTSHVGKAEITVDGTGVDAASYAALETALDALLAERGVRAAAIPPAMYAELWAVAISFPPLFESLHISGKVDGIHDTRPGLNLDTGSLWAGFRLDGVTSGLSSVGLTFGWQDMSIVPRPAHMGEFLPTDITLDVSIVGISNPEVTAALHRFREASRAMDLRAAAAVTVGEFLPVFMLDGGLSLEVGFAAESPVGAVDFEGSFHPQPGSPHLIGGSGAFTIAGIDDAIAAMGAYPEALPALKGLTMLKLVGAETNDPSRPGLRRYTFELGPQGEVTLNGTDLSPLLKAMGDRDDR